MCPPPHHRPLPQRNNHCNVGYAPEVLRQKQGCKLLGHRALTLETEWRRNDYPMWGKGAWPESQEGWATVLPASYVTSGHQLPSLDLDPHLWSEERGCCGVSGHELWIFMSLLKKKQWPHIKSMVWFHFSLCVVPPLTWLGWDTVCCAVSRHYLP